MKTYAFIDASNLFYGGEKSLGWKIDYQKLLGYLKEKYSVSRAFYFGGVEIHNFEYNYQKNETIPLNELEKHLKTLISNDGAKLNEAELLLIGRHLQRVRFYPHLNSFGYKLYLKPVKLYDQEDGTTKRKANCDVDKAFHLMKEKDNFNRAVVLSGDGDFLLVLKYLKDNGKDMIILGRSERTAKEIKQFAGSNFKDFQYLRERLKMSEKKRKAPI
ncbi:MAG: NYN domain-containing protein [Candidatus Sungbacteria bacterium]|nr:NYN domain-containing protein [Candidatus Sungbacteria bacterium]